MLTHGSSFPEYPKGSERLAHCHALALRALTPVSYGPKPGERLLSLRRAENLERRG